MSAQDRAIQKLARELAGIKKEVVSWRGPQADYTSVENGGNFTFKDGDGNVTAVVGGQDDGSNTIRHVDGPTPPIPSGLSAHVDGPIVQVSWDGTFEDGVAATYDWLHLEVIAVGPNSENLRGTISDATGASTNLAATVSGEWTVVARSVSRAEKRSLDGDAGTVDVEIVGLSGAIEAAIGSANGKNTVHYSEVAPTPEDEGIDGDTWFVNSVDPETSIMLITEQWQFLAGVWVQTELDHQVIATLDAGKIVFGEMDGIRIAAKTIRGQQLSGDAIDGKVITGGTYRTTGGSGEWSDAGLFIAQPDGTSMVRFPTDGSPLSLTASDVQIERASITDLDLSYGAVRSGGQVTLASGVTAPASPPELTTGWLKLTSSLENTGAFDPDDQLPVARAGLGYWAEGDGHWVRAVNVLGADGDAGDRLEVYHYVTGEVEQTHLVDINPQQGLTVMGDIVYLMGRDHLPTNTKTWIHGFNLNTGARVSRHEYTRAIQAKNALGNDGTNLLVASVYNNELYVHRRNPVTGVQVGPDMRSGSSSWGGGPDLHGVSVSGSDITVVPDQAARVYTISGGVLTRKTDSANVGGFAGWVNPNRNGAGMVWLQGAPWIVNGQGDVYYGAGPVSDTNVQLCFTWYDGTHETTPSPVATVTVPARTLPSASFPVRAGMQKRLYVRAGSGGWAMYDIPEARTVQAVAVFTGTEAPPTTNTFPNADPATLKSTNDKFVVHGDGSGSWGPLTFNADGTMTSSQIPSWVPLTTFKSGFGPQTWGDVAAYRVWPDGKVEWRGVIAGNISGTTTIATIPVAARPAQAQQFAAATGNPGSGRAMLSRLGFETGSSTIVAYPNGVSVDWISLAGIYYYLT